MWAAGAPLSKMISQAMRRWPLFFFLPPYSSHITTRRRSHTTLTQYDITKAFISILRRETCRRLSLSCKSPLGGARSGVPSSSAQPIENFKLHEDQSPFGSKRNCFEADSAISDFALSKSIGPDPRTVSFVCADSRRRRIFDSAFRFLLTESQKSHLFYNIVGWRFSQRLVPLPSAPLEPNILPAPATSLRNISSF